MDEHMVVFEEICQEILRLSADNTYEERNALYNSLQEIRDELEKFFAINDQGPYFEIRSRYFCNQEEDCVICMIEGNDLTIAYTNGSSNSNLDRGEAGVFFIGPDGAQECHGIPVGKIASNYTCELVAIKSALEIYLSGEDQSSRSIIIFSDCRSALQAIQGSKCQLSHQIIELINKIIAAQKSCILQWIPAHVNIFGNEKADELAKASRNFPQPSNSLTLVDANVVAGRRLIGQQAKRNSIPDLNGYRAISTTITRLRTNHLKGMRLSVEGQRSYTNFCPHCPNDIPMSRQHIFSCPAIQAKLLTSA
ncbi:uncharacterized protein LOC129234319 [Uloborus diversus]|uniref:uncharacterized protein LOC129234319 n=1 Tax=Uloborus diversus TaxID=327109 RepID=UPI00240A4D6A|nr:uncharacterized protein LOC129234319 [Uloborus diversus]